MNITHSVEEKVVGDKLQAIFTRQQELMDKYHYIELRSGLLQTEECPVNLDDKKGQARIKDFAWRIMEEVGEALDAYEDKEHFLEELIDGLHFLTELTILAGLTPEKLVNQVKENAEDPVTEGDGLEIIFNAVNPSTQSGDSPVCSLVKELGMMCNCLKNKPWKQSHMRTDKENFYRRLGNVWIVYIDLLSIYLSPEDIVDVYLRKSQVNKFRQRSNY